MGFGGLSGFWVSFNRFFRLLSRNEFVALLLSLASIILLFLLLMAEFGSFFTNSVRFGLLVCFGVIFLVDLYFLVLVIKSIHLCHNSEKALFLNSMGVKESWNDIITSLSKLSDAPHLSREEIGFITCCLSMDAQEALARRIKEIDDKETRLSSVLKIRYSDLTPNEHSCCLYIIQGKSMKEIAALLRLSPVTVKIMRSHIRQKLGVSEGRNLKTHLQAVSQIAFGSVDI